MKRAQAATSATMMKQVAAATSWRGNVRRVLVAVIVMLAGCAGHRYYFKPGATTEDFETDKAGCQAQAEAATTYQTNPFIAVDQHIRMTDLCLRGKGWRQVAAPEQPQQPEQPTERANDRL
jgi:hypothetical protein